MKELLTKLLEDMDIPEMRRDVNNPANLRWLLRNLDTREVNRNNEHFLLVKELIINLLKNG